MSVKIQNLSLFNRYEERIDQYVAAVERLKIEYPIALQRFIEQNLIMLLGDKIKHFEVEISGVGKDIEIIVRINDALGQYIYHGTQPHTITAGGQAMPIGNNEFATRVHHPGQKSMKHEIDLAINQAKEEANNLLDETIRQLRSQF